MHDIFLPCLIAQIRQPHQAGESNGTLPPNLSRIDLKVPKQREEGIARTWAAAPKTEPKAMPAPNLTQAEGLRGQWTPANQIPKHISNLDN